MEWVSEGFPAVALGSYFHLLNVVLLRFINIYFLLQKNFPHYGRGICQRNGRDRQQGRGIGFLSAGQFYPCLRPRTFIRGCVRLLVCRAHV